MSEILSRRSVTGRPRAHAALGKGPNPAGSTANPWLAYVRSGVFFSEASVVGVEAYGFPPPGLLPCDLPPTHEHFGWTARRMGQSPGGAGGRWETHSGYLISVFEPSTDHQSVFPGGVMIARGIYGRC